MVHYVATLPVSNLNSHHQKFTLQTLCCVFLFAIGPQTMALCSQQTTGMYTNYRIDQDCRWQQYGTQSILISACQWSHGPCNAPTQLYRVCKKLSVKADLAIYSQVDASGQCMSVSLILDFNLNFSSCDNFVGFCKSSLI